MTPVAASLFPSAPSTFDHELTALGMKRAQAVSLQLLLLAALGLGGWGCTRSEPSAAPGSKSDATAATATGSPLPLVSTAPAAAAPPTAELRALPAPERVVAIGDLHGDLDVTKRALQLAGLVDAQGHWSGGKAALVHTGDDLDRGDQERPLLRFLEAIQKEASAANGSVTLLLGNHETINAMGDFRYVTPAGFAAWQAETPAAELAPFVARFPDEAKGRASAFLPGGSEARRFAERSLVARVGDTLFAHGGVRWAHVSYGLERMNGETSEWLRSPPANPPAFLQDDDGPNWTRFYAGGDVAMCSELERVLSATGTKRMVIGHTPQKDGITSACDNRLWRIDVGLAAHYGGPTQVWELRGGQVSILRAPVAAAAE